MKPIFFPFTSLTPYDVKSILAFFNTFSYLSTQSAEELETAGDKWFQSLWRESFNVEPVTLSQEELKPLLLSIKSWRAWAEVNYGKETRSGYLQSIFKDRSYFAGDTGDTAVSSIRAQIEKGVDSVKEYKTEDVDSQVRFMNRALDDSEAADRSSLNEQSQHALNRALLFLRLAMMADSENEAIDQKLASIERLEVSLFSALKGEMESTLMENSEPLSVKDSLINDGAVADQLTTGDSSKSDRGALMTEERLRSWLTLFMAKKTHFKSSPPPVFVTTSRAVIDFILSVSKKSKLMLDIDNFKVHKEKNSSCAGAWSETFKVQWNKDFHRAAKAFLSNEDSLTSPGLCMNIADSELFQVAGQSLTVMLVGVKE